MAQYKIGSVNVTNGSATVTGIGTLWSAEVSSGDIFTIVGDNAWYEIGSVGSNTSITLTSNYAGTTASGAQYAISRDFTTNKSIPYPQKGDIETASLLKRAMNIIDTELSTGFDSSNVTITGGTINGTTIGGTTAAAVSATTLTTSSTVTHNGGTANSVCFLNGSKVLTTGSALTFDGGANLSTGGSNASTYNTLNVNNTASNGYSRLLFNIGASGANGIGGIKYAPGIFFAIGTDSDASSTPMTFNLNGSEQARLTSTGLGIGTSSPSRKLEVNGFSRFTDGTVQTEIVNGGGVGFIGTNNNYPLAIQTNAVERARFDTSGNLGLGVTPSAWGALKGLDISSGGALFGFTAQVGLAHNAFFNGSSWRYKNTDAAAFFRANALGFEWHTAPSGTAGNAISFSQVMTLDASGNLGIGTSSPSAKLHVVGSTFRQTDATGSYGYTINATSNTTTLATLFGGSSFAIQTAGSGTNQLLLDASGNLGLGVTPSAWIGSIRVFQLGSSGALTCDSNNDVYLANNVYYDNADRYRVNDFASIYGQVNGQHRWLIAPSGTAGNAISFTQALTLHASGGMSLGNTSDPGASNLSVSGSATIAGVVSKSSASNSSVVSATNTTNTVLAGAGTGTYLVTANSNISGSIVIGGMAMVTIYFDGSTGSSDIQSISTKSFTWGSISSANNSTNGTITYQQTSGFTAGTVTLSAVKLS